MGVVTCVSGIDTGIGKTVATGLMAKALMARGHSVITQKVVQTGCSGIAEDILRHRELMEVDLFSEDESGLTCPFVFAKACSPHLAAELEGVRIDIREIENSTNTLTARFDHVLLEGAGGLLVPLTLEMTFLDYLEKKKYPLVLVSSPRLGSINHTLAALELAQGRGIEVKGIIYNCSLTSDHEIRHDSRAVFVRYLEKYGFSPSVVDMEETESYFEQEKEFPCLQFFQQETPR
ncbi:MAG: dethiobiotin synthase [Desulfocapsa sp.]|nr:dethiobiotin synthase [Desulfocapsa sp.]